MEGNDLWETTSLRTNDLTISAPFELKFTTIDPIIHTTPITVKINYLPSVANSQLIPNQRSS